jgi:hypothetical protein
MRGSRRRDKKPKRASDLWDDDRQIAKALDRAIGKGGEVPNGFRGRRASK